MINNNVNYYFSKVIVLSTILLLTACGVKMKDLDLPTKSSSFVLSKDKYTVGEFGLLKMKLLYGLRAGKYSLVAEDKEGYFYQGKGNCVIMLNSDVAIDKYSKSGELPDSYKGDKGGIWIPKNGVNKKIRLFHMTDVSKTKSTNYSQGIVVGLLIDAGDGDINYIPFDTVIKNSNQLGLKK